MANTAFTGTKAVEITAGVGLRVLARAKNSHRALLTRAAVASVAVTVADLDAAEIVYQDEAITVADVIYDSLQTPAEWTVDATGYNFAHDLPVEAFPSANKRYEVTYWFTPPGGAVISGSKLRVNTIHAYAPE